jgi:hypothetical protein
MMDRSPKPPEELMQAVARDLRPVSPSPQPVHLAVRLAPLALLVSWLLLAAMGMRRDAGMLGPLVLWGASGLQFVAAIVLVWIAAREATPARRLPRQMVSIAAGAAFLVVVLVSLLTHSASVALRPVPGTPWPLDLACGLGSTIAGGILVLLFAWMFRNSVATRPTVAGALYGAAAGLVINADWRIVCPGSNLRHALGAHGAAIIATVLLGALIGRFLAARKLSTRKRRS